jgi:predicted adenylyl cyclase CyaB
MNDKLLTIPETAAYLKVHWQTIRNYLKEGSLQGVKVGKNVRILESSLEAFLKNEKAKKELHEIEIRFTTDKRHLIEGKLLKIGACLIYQGHVVDHWFVPNEIKNMTEKNEWFDSAKGYGLRIREQDNGYTGKIVTSLETKRLLYPYKHDTCLETEIDVSNYEEIKRVLSAMNLKEFCELDKNRTVYKYKDAKVVIDDIKNFITGIEIEKMTERNREEVIPELEGIAKEIGLDINAEITDKSITYQYMLEFAKF